jgi:hypothetical protein
MMTFNTEKTYILQFTEKEFKTFMEGIGRTSTSRLEVAGMTKEQATLFINLYRELYENIPE